MSSSVGAEKATKASVSSTADSTGAASSTKITSSFSISFAVVPSTGASKDEKPKLSCASGLSLFVCFSSLPSSHGVGNPVASIGVGNVSPSSKHSADSCLVVSISYVDSWGACMGTVVSYAPKTSPLSPLVAVRVESSSSADVSTGVGASFTLISGI